MGYGKIWNLICVIRHRSKNKFILTILKTTNFFLYAASTGSSPYWPQVRVAHTRRQKTWTHVVLFQANPYQPYWPLIVAIQSLEEQLGASLLRFFNQGHLVTSASWAWAILCLDPGSSTACLLSAAITLSHSLPSHLEVVGCITSHQLQQLYHSFECVTGLCRHSALFIIFVLVNAIFCVTGMTSLTFNFLFSVNVEAARIMISPSWLPAKTLLIKADAHCLPPST